MISDLIFNVNILFIALDDDVRDAFNKFPDFFGMDTFIKRTHKKL